jgi:DNA-binding NarL/FixJ family response regulator
VVYLLQVISKIDWFRMKNHDYHHYKGKDLSLFKFPDVELLKIGPGLSEREFEIIKLVESGLSSKEIADKIFLSVHTVNTHRKNILEKTGRAQISDLIYDYKQQGLL